MLAAVLTWLGLAGLAWLGFGRGGGRVDNVTVAVELPAGVFQMYKGWPTEGDEHDCDEVMGSRVDAESAAE